MDTSSYDAKIQAAGAEKDALWSQVETACLDYVQACSRFFADYFQRRVESSVTDQPITTQNLGVERLGELKRELRQLVDNVSEIVAGTLNRSGLWEHRDPAPEGTSGYSAGNKAHEALREIYGHLGQLLLKYGFASAGKDGEWESRPNELPRYKYGLSLSKEIGAAIEKYRGLFSKFTAKHEEQRRLEAEKQQAIAKDLWDQA